MTDQTNSVSDQQKEELLQLMLRLLSNQKEVAEADTTDKEHLQAMSDSNNEFLEITKKLNRQNEKLTEQKSNLVETLAKPKTTREGGSGDGRGGGDGVDKGGNTTQAPQMCNLWQGAQDRKLF